MTFSYTFLAELNKARKSPCETVVGVLQLASTRRLIRRYAEDTVLRKLLQCVLSQMLEKIRVSRI